MPQDRTKWPKTVFERRPLLLCSELDKMISRGPQSFLEANHKIQEVKHCGIRKARL